MQSYPQMYFILFKSFALTIERPKRARVTRSAVVWWVELASTLTQLASVTAQSGETLQQC